MEDFRAGNATREQVDQAASPFRAAEASLDARLERLFSEYDADGSNRQEVGRKLRALLGERRYLSRVMEDLDATP